VGSSQWSIPWPCLQEFIGIVTRPRVFDPPSTLTEAVDQVDFWLACPSIVMLAEADDHWLHLKDILLASRTIGAKVHDARVAAICLQHGVRELWTADRDFSRFPQLKTVNPLVR
jgi:uncharacterized protein